MRQEYKGEALLREEKRRRKKTKKTEEYKGGQKNTKTDKDP
jgi:hypothetical protein